MQFPRKKKQWNEWRMKLEKSLQQWPLFWWYYALLCRSNNEAIKSCFHFPLFLLLLFSECILIAKMQQAAFIVIDHTIVWKGFFFLNGGWILTSRLFTVYIDIVQWPSSIFTWVCSSQMWCAYPTTYGFWRTHSCVYTLSYPIMSSRLCVYWTPISWSLFGAKFHMKKMSMQFISISHLSCGKILLHYWRMVARCRTNTRGWQKGWAEYLISFFFIMCGHIQRAKKKASPAIKHCVVSSCKVLHHQYVVLHMKSLPTSIL